MGRGDIRLFPQPDDDDLLTRRQWLTRRLILAGSDIWTAIEAVSSTAIEHPEWDLEEERTWSQWQTEE